MSHIYKKNQNYLTLETMYTQIKFMYETVNNRSYDF